MQGGFIWDWVDQGLLHKVKDVDGFEVEAWGYGGDFGDPVHDAQFCINGLIWPNRVPHPGALECKAVMVGALAIPTLIKPHADTQDGHYRSSTRLADNACLAM